MSINNIQATKFYDEVRAYFGSQTLAGKGIQLTIKAGKRTDGAIFIGFFDSNNPDSTPLILMVNTLGTGRRWSNELSPNSPIYEIIDSALLAFDKKKEEWDYKGKNLKLEDATDFLITFMKQVSDSLC